jgi:serralysin
VDTNGLMWIEKNGKRLVQQPGVVPANVIRVNKFIGKSNWLGDSPLQGIVSNFQLTNKNSAVNALPEITGAFEVSLTGRYDNVNGAFWQRLFDFGNGPEKDNVWLGQVGNTNDMCLEVWKDGKLTRLVAPGAIINGETATWKSGVDSNGLMWISKNGKVLAQQTGVVPANVIRINKFIGKSNWLGDAPLQGIAENFQLTNKISLQASNDVVSELKFNEITGPFQATMIARFDSTKLYAWQRIFDFGNGPAKDNVWFGQVGNSNDICLEVWRDGKSSRLTAHGALIDGQTATWKVGVDANALMWIEKNGVRLAQIVGLIPANIVRTNKLIGTSNWPGDAPLKGAVLGIDIVNSGQSSNGVLLNQPAQITGAFKIQLFARFDELAERAWQRVFDFGNGPQNDCILLGQCGNTSDMCFHVWKNGVLYSIHASQALKVNEMANWSVGIDTTGFMWISKNGKRIAEGQGTVPANVHRNNNFIGESNWPSDMKIRGVVAGLKVF